MKTVSIPVLCLVLWSCASSQAPVESTASSSPVDEPLAEAPGLLPPGDLLVSRQVWCAEPAAARKATADSIQTSGTSQPSETGATDTGELAGEIDHLLRMSCDIRANHAAIRQALAELRERREWQDAYLALFDLVQTGADAVKSLEQQRAALQARLDETIRGITHIEEAIDARREKSHLAED